MDVLSSRVLLRPRDFERSVHFYREQLGLHVYREWRGGVVFFLGGSCLEVSGTGTDRPTDHLSLWIQVRDLEQAHAELLEAGAEVRSRPGRRPWGLLEMEARDPDGVRLVLVEVPPDHPLRRRE